MDNQKYFLDIYSKKEWYRINYLGSNRIIKTFDDTDISFITLVNLEKKIKHIFDPNSLLITKFTKISDSYIDISDYDFTYKSYIPISFEIYQEISNMNKDKLLKFSKNEFLKYLKLHEWTI